MFEELKKMTDLKKIALSAVAIAVLNGCGDTNISYGDSTVTITGDTTVTNPDPTDTTDPVIPDTGDLPRVTLIGEYDQDMELNNETLYLLEGQVVFTGGAKLTIEKGTVIAGKFAASAEDASYLLIDKGSKIIADGTAEEPIIFTSLVQVETGSPVGGQWGGLTIIGNANMSTTELRYEVDTNFVAGQNVADDNSGVLRHVKIFSSAIAAGGLDKETNGLSMVGVGNGTVVEDITVANSNDDGVEIWGGTVNLKNVTISTCTDDHLDVDSGYTGTIENLVINATKGFAGIEMSGVGTHMTLDGFTITMDGYADDDGEGGIYFKQDGVGGHFKNGTIIYNSDLDIAGAIWSRGTNDLNEISFENVGIYAADEYKFVNKTDSATDSADEIKDIFNNGTGNSDACVIPAVTNLSGAISGCNILTRDTTWSITGQTYTVTDASVRIQDGTTIVGKPSASAADASYLLVDKGSKIYALGTETAPITFTSENQSATVGGLWGGLTIIGNANMSTTELRYEVDTNFVAGQNVADDHSGVLRHVKILNSAIAAGGLDKETNGLSMVGVGNGTVVEDITVANSNDDGVEIWGGTVNLKNVTISTCTDDHLDVDSGYTGTIKNLDINATKGFAGIEMSGVGTHMTLDGFTITMNGYADADGEGGIYFKEDGVGGHFKNGTIIYDSALDIAGAIWSRGTNDLNEISFENVSISTTTGYDFVNRTDSATDSADEIKDIFDNGTGNEVIYY